MIYNKKYNYTLFTKLFRALVFHDKYISKHFIREHISSQDQELLETFYTINLFEVENLLAELQQKGLNKNTYSLFVLNLKHFMLLLSSLIAYQVCKLITLLYY